MNSRSPTVYDVYGRPDRDGIAGLGAGHHLPILCHTFLDPADLACEVNGRGPFESRRAPRHSRLTRTGAEIGCFVIGHVGHDEDHLRMFVQTVGELVKGLAHILHADLLAHHQPRNVGVDRVQVAHHVDEYRGVAHPGIEQAKGIRPRIHQERFADDPGCHLRLLGGGGDEHHVGGPAVEEAGPRSLFHLETRRSP